MASMTLSASGIAQIDTATGYTDGSKGDHGTVKSDPYAGVYITQFNDGTILEPKYVDITHACAAIFYIPISAFKNIVGKKKIDSISLQVTTGGTATISTESSKSFKFSIYKASADNSASIKYSTFFSYVGDEIDSSTLTVNGFSNTSTISIPLNGAELLEWITKANADSYLCVRIEEGTGSVTTAWIFTAANFIINYSDAETTIELGYPKNVNVQNDKAATFMWTYSNDVGLTQIKYEIGWKLSNSSSWTTVTGNSANKYHTFAANTFPAGTIDWRLRVTSSDGSVTGYKTGQFTSIGKTAAPAITSVTNTAIPTINWTVDSQDVFEINIYDMDKSIVYESGIQIGAAVRTFTPNIMLKDGSYFVKIRAMNQYGYFTDWSSYSWILQTEKPEKPTVYVSYGHDATIIVEGETTTDKTYVVRKRESEEDFSIIGVFNGSFTDYECTQEVTEYALRAYDGGFTDSNAELVKLDFAGIYVYDLEDKESCLNLKLSESEMYLPVSTSLKRNTVYAQCIGRKYPVKESNEWITEEKNTEVFLNPEEKEKLEAMCRKDRSVIVKYEKEVFHGDIETLSWKNTLLNKGYNVQITFMRLGDNSEVEL